MKIPPSISTSLSQRSAAAFSRALFRQTLQTIRETGWLPAPTFCQGLGCLLLVATAPMPVFAEPHGPAKFSSQFPGMVWKERLTEERAWNDGWNCNGTTLSARGKWAYAAFSETSIDSGIRVRFVYDGPDKTFLDLFVRSDGAYASPRYVTSLIVEGDPMHTSIASMRARGADEPTGSVIKVTAPIAHLHPGEEHTLEFYAQGQHLLYYLDGTLILNELDSRRQAGRMGISTDQKVHFLSVETSDLTHVPPLWNASTLAKAVPQPSAQPTTLVPSNPALAPSLPVPPSSESPAAPTAPNGNFSRTPALGGQSGKEFAEIQPEGGVLVGLDIWKGTYYRQLVIGGVRAIYRTSKGEVHGQIYGHGQGNPDISFHPSRPGAVLNQVEAIDDREQIIALRIRFSDGEQSPWFGREVPKNLPANKMPRNIETKHISVNGNALGIYGGADWTLFRFGLIH